MGYQFEVVCCADPYERDNDNDAVLLLSVREIVDHSRSRRDPAGVDHQALVRTTQESEDGLEQVDRTPATSNPPGRCGNGRG
jgi:hypothetical protein